jgi:hypothetical protein
MPAVVCGAWTQHSPRLTPLSRTSRCTSPVMLTMSQRALVEILIVCIVSPALFQRAPRI